MGSKQLPATPQQQAIDLLCTYGRRMRAESHCCCEGGGRGVGHAAWSRARRPFSLAGWGLHLASNGINNPNHHIGPVWAGRTPPARTVSIIPGASEPCPQSCHARLIDMDPYRAHVVARMLMACFSARIPRHHTFRININLIFVLEKGKPHQSTNLPIPSNEHTRFPDPSPTLPPSTTIDTSSILPPSKYFPPSNPRNPTFPQPVHLPLRPFDSQLHSAT
jgi:hypothetical protein